MGKTNLNVDRLLAALSVILSERAGAAVKVTKGEKENDVCSNETACEMASSEIMVE